MIQLNLPLVDLLIDLYQGKSFSKVKIIGVQHILETTHSMFQSLYKLGLKPENISILGKCYSTCREVYFEMLNDGIDVSAGSFSYNSHQSFDDLYENEVYQFLSSRTKRINQTDFECIIVLDDGGKCINFFRDFLNNSIPIIAIEQTSSGYHAIKGQQLQFPVINVARSPIKLTLESPMIANAAAERLFSSLQAQNVSFEKALIIGGGVIGQAVREQLKKDMIVKIFDSDSTLNEYGQKKLAELIKEYSLVVGCTGKISIPQKLHPILKPGTVLVSVSSSDREFDAHFLRKRVPLQKCCHLDLHINDLLLVNSGFPVNFDGARENIEPTLIQLTIALITSAILQGRNMKTTENLGIIPLNECDENLIKERFLQLIETTTVRSLT